jgi:hypothetical protein
MHACITFIALHQQVVGRAVRSDIEQLVDELLVGPQGLIQELPLIIDSVHRRIVAKLGASYFGGPACGAARVPTSFTRRSRRTSTPFEIALSDTRR